MVHLKTHLICFILISFETSYGKMTAGIMFAHCKNISVVLLYFLKKKNLGVVVPYLFVDFKKSDTKEMTKCGSILVSSDLLQKVFVSSNNTAPPCRVEG